MFIIIVFDRVLTPTPHVPSQDFYCSLTRDQSRDVTPRLGIFVILHCTSFRLPICIRAIIITTTLLLQLRTTNAFSFHLKEFIQ